MTQGRCLPAGFQFSQSSLQDFIDCPRRFQLRYIWELAWPAIQTEPAMENERFLRKGAFFHHLIHQHLLGIPEEQLTDLINGYETDEEIGEKELAQWWQNYLTWKDRFEGSIIFPETSVSAPQGEFRLVAKYDLVLVSDQGLITIVDWKTSRKRPKSQWLKERMQSKVYPCLMVKAGGRFYNVERIAPEKVEMIYWFADFPQQTELCSYSSVRFLEDQAYISDLVAEIVGLGSDDFPLTARIERCVFCVYRSFCNRGIRAGNLDEFEESLDLDTEASTVFSLDFEQIGEIEY
jgi:CRISPR/Cas system-associated exonuclease Cas4 (RecB family)